MRPRWSKPPTPATPATRRWASCSAASGCTTIRRTEKGRKARGGGGEGGGGSARVEQLLKDLAAADPAAGELRLARYYQSTAQTLPAISAYQRALARLTGGGGIAALQHENQRIQCLEALASLSLDQAEKAGVDTDPGRQRLSDALAWTSKLQPHPPLDAFGAAR
jgi:hypothetical protein